MNPESAVAVARMPDADAPGADVPDDFSSEASPKTASPETDSEGEEDAGSADISGDELFQELRLGKKASLQTEPMTSFFKALDATRNPDEKRLVRILHFGDSHTASDVLTTAIRRALQTRFGDGGRGFVFLGKPWLSYRPIDVEIEADGNWMSRRIIAAKDPSLMDGRYGLGGIAVDAPERGGSATAATSRGSRFCDKASVFEIFYLKQQGGGKFQVRVDGRSQAWIRTDSDRFKSGFHRVELKEGRHSMEVRVSAEQNVRLFGAVMEGSGPGIVYDTLGVNGAFFYTPLRWNKRLLAEQIARRSPDLIVTMYGANEADSRHLTASGYLEQIRQVMSLFISAATGASCLVLGPMDRRSPRHSSDSRFDIILDAQRRVADEMGCGFIDLREMMGGRGAHRRWQDRGLAGSDGVHLTITGYHILGELIAARILDAYDQYRETVSGEQPDSDKDSDGIK